MVTQLQPDVRAYLHGGEVIKRYIRVEEVAHEYGFSVEETEYIAKAASSLYKLTRIHLVKKERFDEFMKHIYKVPGTNKQIIKKFARIGEASIIYSIGRHRFIELARAAGATYKINEGTGGTVLVNLEIFDNYMEQFRQPVRPLKEPLYGQDSTCPALLRCRIGLPRLARTGVSPSAPSLSRKFRFVRQSISPVLQPRTVREQSGLGSSLFDRHY